MTTNLLVDSWNPELAEKSMWLSYIRQDLQTLRDRLDQLNLLHDHFAELRQERQKRVDEWKKALVQLAGKPRLRQPGPGDLVPIHPEALTRMMDSPLELRRVCELSNDELISELLMRGRSGSIGRTPGPSEEP